MKTKIHFFDVILRRLGITTKRYKQYCIERTLELALSKLDVEHRNEILKWGFEWEFMEAYINFKYDAIKAANYIFVEWIK